MKCEWIIKKISSLGDFDRGKSKHRPRDAKHLYGGTYPFIQTGDITNSGGRITTYRQTYNEAGLAQSKLWPEGTLAITIAANIAETALLTFPACFPDSVVGFTADKTKADIRFIEYLFQAMRKQVKSHAYGSAQENINLEVLRNLAFPIPTLVTQTKIADYLSLIDDRITLLRETNTTLEAIAQALFKSWFIDFDPVHAKMQGQSPEGMDKATAALFPDSFDETESGPVPKGWEWKSLKEAYQINPNRQLKKGQSSFYLDMANVNNTGHGVRNLVQREMGSGTKFVNGDTLLARITPCLENGKTAFVDFLPDATTGWGSTEFVVLRPKSPLPTYHAYLLARHASFREHAIRSMSGTSGRQRIQNDVLSQFLIAIPSEKVAVAFNEIITTLQERIQKSNTQANQLSEIRNLLLPHLISGKLLTCKNLETSNT